jgi:hypothetical protein
MCWGPGVSATIVGIGVAATVITVRRKVPAAFSVAIAWFTLMEALQLAGYLVINQCDNPVNQAITLLSMLHIVFQPFFINAFSLQLVPEDIRRRARVPVYTLCGISSAIMLLQLYPFVWAGACEPNVNLCGSPLCTVSGNWHLAWNIPYNGLLVGVDQMIGLKWGFPSYMIVSFLVPLLYGAWRFTIFHAVFGPLLAARLTANVNEVPAVWCLFSLGLVLMALNPQFRQNFEWIKSSSRRATDAGAAP